MKNYLVALAVGLLVGIIYNVLNVRSPAPPVVALVGLLGMLLGEQIIPGAKAILSANAGISTLIDDSRHHVFGSLPGRGLGAQSKQNATQSSDAQPAYRHTNIRPLG